MNVRIEINEADTERVIDALEVLAENYNKASMTRARESCLRVRGEIAAQLEAVRYPPKAKP